MKKLILLVFLPAFLHARLIVNQSELILESHLDTQISSNETVVVKAFDADDEQGKLLDVSIENDKTLPLYKVAYDRMGTRATWPSKRFGDDFMNRSTVYHLYHKGKRLARLHPQNYTSTAQLRGKISQLVQRAA